MVVLCVVYRDSLEVELCLRILKPWLRIVSAKVRKLNYSQVNCYFTQLPGCSPPAALPENIATLVGDTSVEVAKKGGAMQLTAFNESFTAPRNN